LIGEEGAGGFGSILGASRGLWVELAQGLGEEGKGGKPEVSGYGALLGESDIRRLGG